MSHHGKTKSSPKEQPTFTVRSKTSNKGSRKPKEKVKPPSLELQSVPKPKLVEDQMEIETELEEALMNLAEVTETAKQPPTDNPPTPPQAQEPIIPSEDVIPKVVAMETDEIPGIETKEPSSFDKLEASDIPDDISEPKSRVLGPLMLRVGSKPQPTATKEKPPAQRQQGLKRKRIEVTNGSAGVYDPMDSSTEEEDDKYELANYKKAFTKMQTRLKNIKSALYGEPVQPTLEAMVPALSHHIDQRFDELKMVFSQYASSLQPPPAKRVKIQETPEWAEAVQSKDKEIKALQELASEMNSKTEAMQTDLMTSYSTAIAEKDTLLKEKTELADKCALFRMEAEEIPKLRQDIAKHNEMTKAWESERGSLQQSHQHALKEVEDVAAKLRQEKQDMSSQYQQLSLDLEQAKKCHAESEARLAQEKANLLAQLTQTSILQADLESTSRAKQNVTAELATTKEEVVALKKKLEEQPQPPAIPLSDSEIAQQLSEAQETIQRNKDSFAKLFAQEVQNRLDLEAKVKLLEESATSDFSAKEAQYKSRIAVLEDALQKLYSSFE